MAQRASLRGTVTDSTGGVLPGVSIIALNVDQGIKREAWTDQSGSFSIPLLQPGNGDAATETGFTVGGNRTDSVTFLLDGAHNNNLLSNGIIYNPNPDTIAE